MDPTRSGAIFRVRDAACFKSPMPRFHNLDAVSSRLLTPSISTQTRQAEYVAEPDAQVPFENLFNRLTNESIQESEQDSALNGDGDNEDGDLLLETVADEIEGVGDGDDDIVLRPSGHKSVIIRSGDDNDIFEEDEDSNFQSVIKKRAKVKSKKSKQPTPSTPTVSQKKRRRITATTITSKKRKKPTASLHSTRKSSSKNPRKLNDLSKSHTERNIDPNEDLDSNLDVKHTTTNEREINSSQPEIEDNMHQDDGDLEPEQRGKSDDVKDSESDQTENKPVKMKNFTPRSKRVKRLRKPPRRYIDRISPSILKKQKKTKIGFSSLTTKSNEIDADGKEEDDEGIEEAVTPIEPKRTVRKTKAAGKYPSRAVRKKRAEKNGRNSKASESKMSRGSYSKSVKISKVKRRKPRAAKERASSSIHEQAKTELNDKTPRRTRASVSMGISSSGRKRRKPVRWWELERAYDQEDKDREYRSTRSSNAEEAETRSESERDEEEHSNKSGNRNTEKGWNAENTKQMLEVHARTKPTQKNFWATIAKKIPGKSAVECAQRYQQLFPTPRSKRKYGKSKDGDEGKQEAYMKTLALPKGRAPRKKMQAYRSVLRMADQKHGADDIFAKTPHRAGAKAIKKPFKTPVNPSIDVMSPPDVKDTPRDQGNMSDEDGQEEYAYTVAADHDKADAHIQKLKKATRSQKYWARKHWTRIANANHNRGEEVLSGSTSMSRGKSRGVSNLKQKLAENVINNEHQPLKVRGREDEDEEEVEEGLSEDSGEVST